MIKVFKGIIPKMACNTIIREGLTRPLINAGTGKDNKKSKGRSTSVAFIDNPFTKSYIYELVTKHYEDYKITEAEDLQFAIYKQGDFYGLHKDADEENKRVLSISVQLSKPKDYEGGDLKFEKYCRYDGRPIERAQGTVIIFPSNLYHEVTPVTMGIRYSLVQWFKGSYESGNK